MKCYGLIGYPLTHSFSQKYFTEKFTAEKINAEFINLPIPSINDFTQLNDDYKLNGLSVTIPYKKQVIAFLDKVTDVVVGIKACNCIQYKNEKTIGHNTDIIGFEKSFTPLLQPYHIKALILGTGGASAAVEYVLNKLEIDYHFVSRTKITGNYTYSELNKDIISEHLIIINASPVGTFPNIHQPPQLPYQFISSKHYLYDLVYNPPFTKFLQLGQQQNAVIKNGYDMLLFQAEESWRIWNE